MLPLTLLAPQKLQQLLTANSVLQSTVQTLAGSAGATAPAIATNQIVISTVSADLADKNAQLTYPRICLYTTQVKNQHTEKFCSFSGAIAISADIWNSSALLEATDSGLHFLVEGLTAILQANQGDWGDGFYFSGLYDVQMLPVKAGGFGFVETARVTCVLNVNIP